MKLIKYKEIIKNSREKKDTLLAPIRAMRMKKKAESEMIFLEEKLIELEAKTQDLCANYPLDFEKLMDMLDEHALFERRKQQYSEVIQELFGE